jgi:preprotein translocase subunit SecD
VAPPPGTLRVGRYFLALLALLAVLYAIVFFPGNRHRPKLGIDLVGGIRVVFTAQTPKGSPAPTSAQMTQARQILEDRINGTGVTGSTVVVQGSNQLVVEIPNGTSTDVAKLGKAAILNFRGLMAPAVAVTCGAHATPANSASASPSGTPSGSSTGGAKSSKSAGASHAPHDANAKPLTAPKPSPAKAKATPKATPRPSSSPATASSGAAASTKCLADPITPLFKTDPSLKSKMPNAEECPSPGIADNKCKAYSALSSAQKQELTSALQRYQCSAAQTEPDIVDKYYIACDNGSVYGTTVAYLLGHVVVPGRHISSASAQAPSVGGTGGSAEWTVNLTLNGSGANEWNAWTSKYNTGGNNTSASALQCGASSGTPCSDFVGFTLDGQVISAPVTLAALDRQTQISGNFTHSSASELAKELNYGKLPVSFRADDIQNVSATLGNTQLKAAFLAGGIGLALVVLYSLIYYRALGFVTIASLIVSAGLTYAMLVILSSQIGFTLDLSGIAGFIVALGITADSFVVFFERIKDEVHEGRSLRVAVPRAWVRARRTILSADTVSFLAAAILYYFASADVKGFAFTLGMSTILDLVVVFLFTHPMISILSRLRAFGSPKFTGLSSVRVGGIAVSDDEPAPRRKPPSRTRPARQEAAQKSSVAVLEAEEDTEPEPPPEPDEARPRRHTSPEPGTAAERAAARRARLRGDDSGEGKR